MLALLADPDPDCPNVDCYRRKKFNADELRNETVTDTDVSSSDSDPNAASYYADLCLCTVPSYKCICHHTNLTCYIDICYTSQQKFLKFSLSTHYWKRYNAFCIKPTGEVIFGKDLL